MATRRSLVDRLGRWSDQRNWQEFFDTYWKLIYSVARKSGLDHAEAQDVVQETVLSVAKRAGKFRYDPAAGSFKAWLLQLTRWRIVDVVRKRQPAEVLATSAPNDSRRTAVVERAADPAANDFDAMWDAEWRENLMSAALARVKRQVEPKQYQIFDCYVRKQWAPAKVAKEFGVTTARVYLTKHRVTALLKAQLKQLEAHGG